MSTELPQVFDLERLLEPVSPERLPEFIDRFIAYYRDHIADQSRPFPAVEETLAALRGDGARLAVLTNKPQVLTVPILERLGLANLFGVICGAGRYDYNKPDARVVKHVVDELLKLSVKYGDVSGRLFQNRIAILHDGIDHLRCLLNLLTVSATQSAIRNQR